MHQAAMALCCEELSCSYDMFIACTSLTSFNQIMCSTSSTPLQDGPATHHQIGGRCMTSRWWPAGMCDSNAETIGHPGRSQRPSVPSFWTLLSQTALEHEVLGIEEYVMTTSCQLYATAPCGPMIAKLCCLAWVSVAVTLLFDKCCKIVSWLRICNIILAWNSTSEHKVANQGRPRLPQISIPPLSLQSR